MKTAHTPPSVIRETLAAMWQQAKHDNQSPLIGLIFVVMAIASALVLPWMLKTLAYAMAYLLAAACGFWGLFILGAGCGGFVFRRTIGIRVRFRAWQLRRRDR